MTTPYIAVHGFIIDGTVTNSHADLTVAVRNGLRVEVVDGAVLGMLFPDGIPEELLTFVEPMYELSFETGLLSCLDSTVSTGAFDAWLELPEVVQYRYRCLPRVRVKVVSRVILNVSQIMLGVTSIAEKIGIDFAKSQKDFVYATDESDFTLVALLGLSSTLPFYSHSGGVDGNGFEVHLSLLPSEVSAAAKYTLLATADLRDENAIYETAYSSSSLTGYILDSNELMPVVYVREGEHCATAQG